MAVEMCKVEVDNGDEEEKEKREREGKVYYVIDSYFHENLEYDSWPFIF